ncbi:ribonuclease H2, subunit B [Schizophyllum fasciatum]
MATYIGILPDELIDTLSAQANIGTRLLRLPHPRTGIPSLFAPYASGSKVAEVQAVAPPNERSWFIGDSVVADGRLLVMTPMDPTFLLIPLLTALQSADGSLGQLRPWDDICEDIVAKLSTDPAAPPKDRSTILDAADLSAFLQTPCCRSALGNICQCETITPEITVYRYDPARLTAYLQRKVSRLANSDLQERSRTVTRGLAKDGLMEDGMEELLELGRTRAACDLVSQYLPRDVYSALKAAYDFAPLDAHLQTLHEADVAAQAANPKTAKEKKKGGGAGKGISTPSTDSKKRKGKGSQGVEKLKKANTEGMSKLSSYFTKK